MKKLYNGNYESCGQLVRHLGRMRSLLPTQTIINRGKFRETSKIVV
jgi:hypothetical protein